MPSLMDYIRKQAQAFNPEGMVPEEYLKVQLEKGRSLRECATEMNIINVAVAKELPKVTFDLGIQTASSGDESFFNELCSKHLKWLGTFAYFEGDLDRMVIYLHSSSKVNGRPVHFFSTCILDGKVCALFPISFAYDHEHKGIRCSKDEKVMATQIFLTIAQFFLMLHTGYCGYDIIDHKDKQLVLLKNEDPLSALKGLIRHANKTKVA